MTQDYVTAASGFWTMKSTLVGQLMILFDLQT